MFFNYVKRACYAVTDWPSILEKLRALCRFFRNTSWRKALIAKLQDTFPEARSILKRFEGHFSSWRYQTIHTVLSALLKVRFLPETYLINVVDLLPSCQETALLTKVQSFCRDQSLWIFIDVFLEFLVSVLEHARRWDDLPPLILVKVDMKRAFAKVRHGAVLRALQH